MKWLMIEAGEYWSEDNRFHISKSWNKIYNNHWLLIDNETKKEYSCDSLKQCKYHVEKYLIME